MLLDTGSWGCCWTQEVGGVVGHRKLGVLLDTASWGCCWTQEVGDEVGQSKKEQEGGGMKQTGAVLIYNAHSNKGRGNKHRKRTFDALNYFQEQIVTRR